MSNPSVVQVVGATATASNQISNSLSVTAGDWIVVFISAATLTNQVSTILDGQGNVYAEVPGAFANFGDANQNLDVWVAVAKETGTVRPIVTMGSADTLYCLWCDVTGVSQGSSIAGLVATSFSCEDAVWVQSSNYGAGVLYLAAIGIVGADTTSVASPWTMVNSSSGVATQLGLASSTTFWPAEFTVNLDYPRVTLIFAIVPPLTNLTGLSDGLLLSTGQFNPVLGDGWFCDMTVRQGVISGLEVSGDGEGIITPIDNLAYIYTILTNRPRILGQSNTCRASEVDRLLPPYVNGQTVLFVNVIDDAGDMMARLIT